MDVIFNGVLKSTKNAKKKGVNLVKTEKFPKLLINFNIHEKVNDEIRGILVFNQTNYDFISVPKYLLSKSQKPLQRLVLLLESPHKDEYHNNQPIRPANGATGAKIKAFISNRANNWPLSTLNDYEVLLVNAIQYQTSCYKLLGKKWDRTNRNHVFKLLFYNFNLKNDLKNRLNTYKADYIINCVTKTLKNDVQEFLENSFKNYCKLCKDEHPSAWK